MAVGATVVATGTVVTPDAGSAAGAELAPKSGEAETGAVVADDAETGYRTGRTDGSATRAASTTTRPITPIVNRAPRVR